MKSYNFFALDIGATSGRCFHGIIENGKLSVNELIRFPNKILKINDKYYWDIYALFEALLEGLRIAVSQNIRFDAIGIDTWGVDFVFLAKDGTFLNLPRSYRDPYTENIQEEYFESISKKELYDLTGIQMMNFNTIFQLFAAKKEKSCALEIAEKILFIPDALSYLLTNKITCEYTIGSTSQLINPKTKKFEQSLFESMNLSHSLMGKIVMPGKQIGYLSENIMKETNSMKIPVIAVAGHDTASAVVSIPSVNKNFAYISSGTWSLMGIEVKEPIITQQSYEMNFTNEGGVDGTIRFLKNITGMWLLERCRSEWEKFEGITYNYLEIVKLSNAAEGFKCLIDLDDKMFSNPENMEYTIVQYCLQTDQPIPKTHSEFVRCIFDSLALKYKYVLEHLRKMAPFPIEKLHVIGGGSKNKLLNQFTANATGIEVVAGPAEATAIGNIMMQARGIGAVDTLEEMREIIHNSIELDVFYPQNTDLWNNAYKSFLQIIIKKEKRISSF